jgi:[ribosomal protein S5]-alanine N-acetyltransferase
MEKPQQKAKTVRPRQILGAADRVVIRVPLPADIDRFLDMVAQSRELHHPWVSPPDTQNAFREYLERDRALDHKALLVCHRVDQNIIGVFNLSQIVRRSFQSAYLAYYVDARYAGQGYMTEGLRLVLRHAFVYMRLHRLEANVQPDNVLSINLLKRCGFNREGYSPRYLKINNRWRDHERWAILAESWRSSRRVKD